MHSPLARSASAAEIPAPVGGWNARDPLSAMRATDAVVLDNMVAGPGGVATRGGAAAYATGLGNAVNALLRFDPPGAAPRLFACAGPGIWDATAAGPVGQPAVAGQTGDRWRGCMFGTAGGAFLVALNGTDAPLRFDGASWAPIKWQTRDGYPCTLTPTKLTAPTVFGARIWAVERGSLKVWFKPVLQVDTAPASGSADPSVYDQCLDLGSQCRLGGALVQMGVWTRDGGTGSDDYAVFLTSSGEVLVYAGTDPTNAATWSLVGVFRVAPPIGDRPMVPAGADLGILTETGLLPLSQVLALDAAQDEQVAITDKIRGAFQAAYQGGATLAGWAVQDYPMGGLVVVNVPRADGSYVQFVQSLLTGAWSSWSGLQATCWALLGDRLMFGTPDGRVCQYDVGSADTLFPAAAPIERPIPFLCLPAFSRFRTTARKRFTMARPLYTSALGYRAPIALRVDFDTTALPLPQPPLPPDGTPWGSDWGSPWGPTIAPSAAWTGLRGRGLVASILVSGASFNPFRLDKIDVLFEASGDPL